MTTIEERAYKVYPIDEEFRKDFEELKEKNGIHNICVDDSFSKERYGYIKACEEYESLPKIHGWVARNKEPNELIFAPGNEAPVRMATYWFNGFTWGYTVIPDVCPDLTWADEPKEVELLIREV